MPRPFPTLHLCLLAAVITFAAALTCSTTFAATTYPTPRFAHENSDLKPEKAARFGQLANGMRYVVMPNKEPKERASLRLMIMAGSLHEEEDQRGLAHFLEHMAFNGSQNYPPGTLIEYFQRLGMSFGGDTNAYTSFDHTAYMLELPDTKAATFDEGLRVFRDYAEGLLLLEKELNKERGIILAEKRARDSVEYRQFVAEFEFLLGESRFPQRLPIGLASVLEKAPRDRFVDFYNAWYRPERMAVVAVGDFDAAAVEKQIASAFSEVKPRAAAQAEPALGRVAKFEGIRATYHPEPEAGATAVSIQTVSPYSPEPDTAANRIKYLPRDLAVAMLNRRLSILAKKENAPFISGKAEAGEGYDFFRNAAIELTCKPTQWSEALALAEQELRRALQFGFQPAELAEVVAHHRNAFEQAAKTAGTRRSDTLASEIVQALAQGRVVTSPPDDLALYGPALSKVTVEECTAGLRAAFSDAHRYISVMGNAKIEGDAVAAIRSAYETSHAQKVTPPEKIEDAAFAYTEFGAPGEVKERKHVDDLDLTLITFANGVRLNFKKTDFEDNQIHLSVRIGVGQLTEPKDQPGLAFFASNTFTAGGLGRHSADDLRRILAGKTVGLGFRAGSDALLFNGSTHQGDLLLQLQLLAAYIVDPGYRPESLRVAQKVIEQVYTRLDHTPGGPLQREVPRLLANGDARFGLPQREAVLARTLEESRAWLTPQLTSGPIEIALVGDLDPEATIAAIAKTFGALPPREKKPALEERRQVSFPAEPFIREFTVPTEIPKGTVALYWPTDDARDIQQTRRLRLLSDVVSDRLRLKIREELGESYSPQAANAPSDTYRDYGYLYTLVTIDPAKVEPVRNAVLEIAETLAKSGVSADELERAKKPVLTALRESSRTNAYWLSAVLAAAQEFPERLDWCRSRYSDNEAITADELTRLAQQYLPTKHAFQVVVVPENAAKPPAK